MEVDGGGVGSVQHRRRQGANEGGGEWGRRLDL